MGALGSGVEVFVCAVGLILLFKALGVFHDPISKGWALGSFGASMTLILGCPDSPLGSYRHAIVGNVGCALIGVLCRSIWMDTPAYAATIAITGSIVFMSLTRSMHPPGGASALLAIFGGEMIESLGWLYPLCPVLVGTLWILFIRYVGNRVRPSRELAREHT